MLLKDCNGKEYDIKYVHCNLGVRYWDDGYINGMSDDNNNPKMPCAIYNETSDTYRWLITIDVETGKIINWQNGITANVSYKVCDDGIYTYTDKYNNITLTDEGYVPSYLEIDEDGFGDYVCMTIDADGSIRGWDFQLPDYVSTITEVEENDDFVNYLKDRNIFNVFHSEETILKKHTEEIQKFNNKIKNEILYQVKHHVGRCSKATMDVVEKMIKERDWIVVCDDTVDTMINNAICNENNIVHFKFREE